MEDVRYLDYTQVKRHRTRIWRVSNFNLARWGGVDFHAIAASIFFGVVVAIPFGILLSILRLPAMVLSIIVLLLVSFFAYSWFTRENIKDTPSIIFKKMFMRRVQPKKYAQAIGADFAADTMQWQVILWRPDWANVRLGDPRRWVTYDPAPISEQVREDIDPTGAGEVVDWNRHFYFDEEIEAEPTFTSTNPLNQDGKIKE